MSRRLLSALLALILLIATLLGAVPAVAQTITPDCEFIVYVDEDGITRFGHRCPTKAYLPFVGQP